MKLRALCKNALLFMVGGSIYYALEFLWKTLVSHNPCHWSMFVLGGALFIILGGLNEYLPWEMSLLAQALIGAAAITFSEFIFGLILNIWLGSGIWDYSTMPFNILGQVCLPFSIAWIFLSILAILLDDFLRWKWFNEQKPTYHLF